MKVSPRYDADPIITLDGDPSAVRVPLVRQRRRFAEMLSHLAPEEWERPSRCEGWRVQDVAVHLTSVDRFWAASIAAGLSGKPSRFLEGFDPKATPAMIVASAREQSAAETLRAFSDAAEALCAAVASLDDESWIQLAEAPPGHLTISTIAHHALWDAWIHERDVLEPMGRTQVEEADEIAASLRYAAALSPAFALTTGREEQATLLLDVTRPDLRIVVTVDDDVHVYGDGASPSVQDPTLALAGDGVEVLEALSARKPWRQTLPPEKSWLVDGIATAFESAAVR